ncbi:DegT/DnrJ/EryC1/StrS family aminotransferase [Candidatus Woesearchaeota archaeon]|nr:DegT/DnrJ/EryC1/StrS family aminotransferase [Candidatus Woesearchaeota archaeon]
MGNGRSGQSGQPVRRIPVSEPSLSGNEEKYVLECISTNWISSLGKFIPEFEGGFAGFCGSKYGVAVMNGTVALQLALAALGIKEGDEVIIPDLTFVATANAVRYLGAKPVFVDSEPATWNIDAGKIESAVTKKTKAIIPVHLYGHPCDMDVIMEVAEKHSLSVIEDAAEAHGAEYKGKRVGSIGSIGCFSFYGNKIITTGEGGMCVTSDAKLAERMHFLKDHAMDKVRKYWHPELGYNFRMTNIQAAVGVAQLEQIDKFIAAKIRNAKLYRTLLQNVKGLAFQPQMTWAKSVYWMHSVLVDEKEFGCSRDALILGLKEKGVDSRPFFCPMHQLPPYKGSGSDKDFPVAAQLSRAGINLPSSVRLSESDIRFVCDAIRSIQK